MLPAVMLSVATSCIDDDSEYGGAALPSIAVTGTDSEEMPVVDINYGEDCEIDPQVSYSGSAQLSYVWSVCTYNNEARGEFTQVSEEPTFSYFFSEGGSYIVMLNLTDGTVGLSQEYRVNVNRTFELGYAVVSNDANGVGNLVFIKDRTAAEIEAGAEAVVMDHCIERVNENATEEPLVGVMKVKLTYPNSVTRIAVCTASRCYFLDPNTFQSMSTIDFEDVIPGFSADQFYATSTTMRAYDQSMRRYVTLNASDMFGYEESGLVGHGYDKIFFGSYESYGTINFEHYYVERNPLKLHGYSAYRSYGGFESWDCTDRIVYDGKTLFDGEELVSVFMGEDIPGQWGIATHPCYVITHDTTTGKYYTTYMMGFGNSSTSQLTVESRGEMSVTSSSAVPATESVVVPSNTYHRNYFYSGNRVYVMLLNDNSVFNVPDAGEWCLEYQGEEVTYLTINTDTEELLVATETTATGRGNIYIYNVADVRTDNPGATPTLQYKDCADRISDIMYKPRIAN